MLVGVVKCVRIGFATGCGPFIWSAGLARRICFLPLVRFRLSEDLPRLLSPKKPDLTKYYKTPGEARIAPRMLYKQLPPQCRNSCYLLVGKNDVFVCFFLGKKPGVQSMDHAGEEREDGEKRHDSGGELCRTHHPS